MKDEKITHTSTRISYEIYKKKFASESKEKHRHSRNAKIQKEKEYIKKALASLEPYALVLDLPCGDGILTHYIQSLGFQVIGADCSTFMLNQARKNEEHQAIIFEQQDVLAIKHCDNMFSATVCNHLFHHYPNAELRRLALAELARVTDGPIILSFFNSDSITALWLKFKNKLRSKNSRNRIALSLAEFKQDIHLSGLTIIETYQSKFGLSAQTYLKLIKK